MHRTCLTVVVALTLATAAHAQTISQDYARYSGMLNDERARTADLDRQDQSRLNNSSGSSSEDAEQTRRVLCALSHGCERRGPRSICRKQHDGGRRRESLTTLEVV